MGVCCGSKSNAHHKGIPQISDANLKQTGNSLPDPKTKPEQLKAPAVISL